jgi:hypothetical protein
MAITVDLSKDSVKWIADLPIDRIDFGQRYRWMMGPHFGHNTGITIGCSDNLFKCHICCFDAKTEQYAEATVLLGSLQAIFITLMQDSKATG